MNLLNHEHEKIENNIRRIRNLLQYDYSAGEIKELLSGELNDEEMFLYIQAAKILMDHKEYNSAIEKAKRV